jgi:GNAT superfamily N-acetyltransferase
MSDATMKIRPAVGADCDAISAVLQQLVAAGKRTRPSDIDFVRTHYVENPDGIRCLVAEDEDGAIHGFQSLSMAVDGNEYGAPVGWGLIGTHIGPNAARRGVGARLFDVTKEVAKQAGLPAIEAYIGAGNLEGQAYYEAMGFRTHRHTDDAVCKRFDVG